jgi:4-amino-4-deoxy-L-arabinose transferase-like glycosyltransferase
VAAVGTVLSISAFAYYYSRGATLAYTDGLSHLLIARRVVSSVTPGFGQLGSVWLPLPHLLMGPLTLNSYLFYQGMAGSVVSMVSAVVAAVFVYRTLVLLTARATAGWVAALTLLLNPDVLYMQSTPMTESLLLACIAGAVYGLAKWTRTENWRDLTGAAFAVFVATLVRYEGWVLLIAFGAALLYVMVQRRYAHDRTTGSLLFFGTLAAAGVAAWLAWNQVISGDALGFQRGQYARPSLWVQGNEVAKGHLAAAFGTYSVATAEVAGVGISVLALISLIPYLIRTRLRPEMMAPLTPLAFFPFFVLALYAGQRPLHIPPFTPDLYNVRFALVMVIPIAMLVGWAVSALPTRLPPWSAGVGAVILTGSMALLSLHSTLSGNVLTYTEPVAAEAAAPRAPADWLRAHYSSGRVLMQSWGNEYLSFHCRIPTSEVVYEGSYRVWGRALANPAAEHIDWIVMSTRSEDEVWKRLHQSTRLDGYVLVYRDGNYLVYRHGHGTHGPEAVKPDPSASPSTAPAMAGGGP